MEIDRFKTINDRFGYQQADALLVDVAASLRDNARRYFAGHAAAFHVHGDEFYVLGPGEHFTVEELQSKLDAMRDAVSHIELTAGPGPRMRCTVSIGWSESQSGTVRELQHDLEIAVAHAKRTGRNRVVKFDMEMRKDVTISLRSDCTGCRTTFTFDIPALSPHRDDVYCPNCGTRSPRPDHAGHAPEPADITDLPQVPLSPP